MCCHRSGSDRQAHWPRWRNDRMQRPDPSWCVGLRRLRDRSALRRVRRFAHRENVSSCSKSAPLKAPQKSGPRPRELNIGSATSIAAVDNLLPRLILAVNAGTWLQLILPVNAAANGRAAQATSASTEGPSSTPLQMEFARVPHPNPAARAEGSDRAYTH